MNYLILNGKLLPADQASIYHTNRAFRYGDGVFESMMVWNGHPYLLDLHLTRIQEAAAALKINFRETLNEKYFRGQIQQLIEANHFKNARVRLVVYRSGGGYYAPDQNESEYLLEATEVQNDFYIWHDKGLNIGLYNELKKPRNFLSPYKTCNSLLYVMASKFKEENNFDECLILNEPGRVCELISSNLFMVKRGVLITTAASEAPILGVMRRHIIDIALKNQLEVAERSIRLDELVEGDELFTTNIAGGIRWIHNFYGKEYKHNVSFLMYEMLKNEKIKNHK